jgi:dTDP-4-dehydrorhamnose 3,5-epimerase
VRGFSDVVAGQASGIVMKVTPASLNGVLILEPRILGDERGYFLESYNQRTMAEIGIQEHFVQDNHSFSAHNVVRGLHYQVQRPQGKLVRVVAGEILDVAVDLRRNSPTFGRWEAVRLSGHDNRMLWMPAGLAHGFRVVSDDAHVLYKATDFYFPEFDRTLAWNDPDLKIDWQLDGEAVVSAKDNLGVPFRQAEVYE